MGFRHLVLAEWTKLRTVRRWVVALVAAVLLTALVAGLLGVSAFTDANDFPKGDGSYGGDDDLVVNGLRPGVFGVVVIIAVAVLFATSEYKNGIVRTTFVVSPQRGKVLAAKTLVVGVTGFAVGLAVSLVSFSVFVPLARGRGFAPPAYPEVHLSDGSVQRAVVGTAVVFALIAVLAMALGMLLRKPVGAITTMVVVVVLGEILLLGMPELAQVLGRVTPLAGFAVQQVRLDRPDVVIGPWVGVGVLALWTLGVLLLAAWQLRRRDA